jgi:hypothetical protein
MPRRKQTVVNVAQMPLRSRVLLVNSMKLAPKPLMIMAVATGRTRLAVPVARVTVVQMQLGSAVLPVTSMKLAPRPFMIRAMARGRTRLVVPVACRVTVVQLSRPVLPGAVAPIHVAVALINVAVVPLAVLVSSLLDKLGIWKIMVRSLS